MLGGLDPVGARELLGSGGRAHLLDAEPELTEQLLEICDYIPDFLRRAANTLDTRRRDHKPVSRLVAELRRGSDPRGFDGVLTGLGLNGLPTPVRGDLDRVARRIDHERPDHRAGEVEAHVPERKRKRARLLLRRAMHRRLKHGRRRRKRKPEREQRNDRGRG